MKSETLAQLQIAAAPLIALLKEPEFSPHHTVKVTSNSLELIDGVFSIPNLEKVTPNGGISEIPFAEEPKELTFDEWFEANKDELLAELSTRDPYIFIVSQLDPEKAFTELKQAIMMKAQSSLGRNPKSDCDCLACIANKLAWKNIST